MNTCTRVCWRAVARQSGGNGGVNIHTRNGMSIYTWKRVCCTGQYWNTPVWRSESKDIWRLEKKVTCSIFEGDGLMVLLRSSTVTFHALCMRCRSAVVSLMKFNRRVFIFTAQFLFGSNDCPPPDNASAGLNNDSVDMF